MINEFKRPVIKPIKEAPNEMTKKFPVASKILFISNSLLTANVSINLNIARLKLFPGFSSVQFLFIITASTLSRKHR